MYPPDERAMARERLTILDAMSTAVERRVEFLDLVGGSRSADQARERLQSEWGFSQAQAHAVLDLQVRRFADLERERITKERAMLARELGEPD